MEREGKVYRGDRSEKGGFISVMGLKGDVLAA